LPSVAVGEDEFVELDEQGNPKPRTGRGKLRRETTVRTARKATPAVRRRPAIAPSIADVAGEDDGADLDAVTESGEAAAGGERATTRRRPSAGGASRRRS
jgi:hypothetical protein